MANMGLQLIGFFLGLLGWFGTVITTIIPHWRRKAHVGANIITAIEVMEGLWMQCIWQSTGIYQCQVHRSQLALSDTLRAMRAMMVISCLLSALGAGVSVVGMKCTVCLGDSSAKGHMAVLGGICFILGGISCLIPVSWSTSDLVREFYNPIFLSGSKYEMGEALYIGFVSTALTLVGGFLLCLSCPRRPRPLRPPHLQPPHLQPPHLPRFQAAPQCRTPTAYKGNHPPSRTSASHSGYRLQDYV
ncbi:claudin-14 [Callorhinchus milii]|uniref:claudin-14 n=1 Tax=Callorhinchus milii TaxID=7868 RepID=UPI00045755FF|nr:claudin-14 [Callorhinchus milii]|eukprot:gi/632980395/ref/XP_007907010.1/ PREDICTED: claudin-14 [Callorhinchus milii]